MFFTGTVNLQVKLGGRGNVNEDTPRCHYCPITVKVSERIVRNLVSSGEVNVKLSS